MECAKKMNLYVIHFCALDPALWNSTHSSEVSWSYVSYSPFAVAFTADADV